MGLLYGFSLFETFMVNKHYNVFLLEKHIERMLNSACYFDVDVLRTQNEIMDIVKRYIIENKAVNKIIRLTLTAGNKQNDVNPSLLLSNRENIYTPQKITDGCKLYISEVKKGENSIIIKHKTGNYLENYFLLQNAMKNGYDDVLFLNSKAQVTESSKCNIFFIKNDTLCTPEISCGLLPGIIRAWIIESTHRYGLKCIEGNFNIDDLLYFDEIFVCNSAMGIMHVKTIDGRIIGLGNIGEITKLLQKELFLNMEYNG
ncbi:MAG: aminotransferase class IV [Eubacteriales bacterium]